MNNNSKSINKTVKKDNFFLTPLIKNGNNMPSNYNNILLSGKFFFKLRKF